ncbi:MAG: hypothetical protein AAF253_10590 [Pseudomonadota bacterium]
MPRDVDERKKRQALRKLRKAADLAEQGLGPPLSDWEVSFLEELEERIETYGSAFADPTKGDLSEPLSARQKRKLKEIDKKARGKGKDAKKPNSAKTNSFGRPGAKPARKSAIPKHPVPKRTIPTEDGDNPAAARRPARKKAPGLRLVDTGAGPVSPPPDPAKPPNPAANASAGDTANQQDKTGAQARPAFRVIDGGKTD